MHPLIDLFRASIEDTQTLGPSIFSPDDIEWAIYAGLGPILYRAVLDAPDESSHTIARDSLHSADLTARVLIGNLLDATSDILAAAPVLASEVTLLKGVATNKRYPEPHLRTMGDIDLLVHNSRVQFEIESLLLDLGYRQQSEYPPVFYETHHHSMPFYHPERNVWVEVHTALFPHTSPVARDRVFSAKRISTQTVPFTFRGIQTRRLSDELELVYTCSHWAKDLNQQRGLIPLFDVQHLLNNRQTPIDWNCIFGWLDGSVAAAHLYLMLTYLGRYGLVDIPPDVSSRLASVQKNLNALSVSILHRIIDSYLLGGRRCGRIATASHISVWSSLLAPSTATRNLLSVPWRLMFPPDKPQRFSPMYNLRRLVSVLGLKN